MSGRKPKHDNRVLRYLTKNGPTTQAVIAKGLKMNIANIYPIVKRMVEQGKVRMDGKFVCPLTVTPVTQDKKEPTHKDGRLVKLSGAPETKAMAQPANKPKVVPNEHVDRIAMLKDEIDNINDGIRSLMITRSYLLRRAQEETANV